MTRGYIASLRPSPKKENEEGRCWEKIVIIPPKPRFCARHARFAPIASAGCASMDLCLTLFADDREEPTAGTGQSRHHRSNRNIGRFGDLAIVEAFDVSQHKGFAKRRR